MSLNEFISACLKFSFFPSNVFRIEHEPFEHGRGQHVTPHQRRQQEEQLQQLLGIACRTSNQLHFASPAKSCDLHLPASRGFFCVTCGRHLWTPPLCLLSLLEISAPTAQHARNDFCPLGSRSVCPALPFHPSALPLPAAVARPAASDQCSQLLREATVGLSLCQQG